MSVLVEFVSSPAGWSLLFIVAFAVVLGPGMWLVFRKHDREMSKIMAELEADLNR